MRYTNLFVPLQKIIKKMLFGLIFSLLTATYSLSSTTAVDGSGDIPKNSSYYYERSAKTGQKGQMTAGNSTHLHLEGWSGCKIHSISLKMRSNTTAGAGALRINIDNSPAWIIDNADFSESYWAGQYSTDWVEIKKEMNTHVQKDIDIVISASTNSLYIDEYTITYEQIDACYTVEFRTGLDTTPPAITQSTIGETIPLPAWQDTALWYFVGWSEKEIEESNHVKTILLPGSDYIPKRNTTLWAVYSNIEKIDAVNHYQSGEYIITHIGFIVEEPMNHGWAMYGTIDHNQIPLCPILMSKDIEGQYNLFSPIKEDMIYHIDFMEDSTLNITHQSTQSPIGYKDNNLFPEAKSWKYKTLNDKSLVIYFNDKSATHALYFGMPDLSNSVAYAEQLNIEKWTEEALWLFPVYDSKVTSWPFGKYNSVQSILHPTSSEGYMLHFGTYLLYIKDGKKYLICD